MIAAHGQIKSLRIGVPPSLNFTYAPPIDFRRISVLLVASHNAAFATNALRHVEVEAVLLSRFELSLRNARRWRERSNLIEPFLTYLRPSLTALKHEGRTVFCCPLDKR
jgi:hypothetical protein